MKSQRLSFRTRPSRFTALGRIAALLSHCAALDAATPVPTPNAYVVLANDRIEFPEYSDCNTPAYWDYEDGALAIHVFNSAGYPHRSYGPSLRDLGHTEVVAFTSEANGGRWMEAVVRDREGILYGYYHNEPYGPCNGVKTAPRIGAARSTDGGRTWDDLGILIEAPPASFDCETPNPYFVGGVGDFSVILDPEEKELYFFLSTYARDQEQQGVAVARMLWADRDSPAGKIATWYHATWVPAEQDEAFGFTPIYTPAASWHDPDGRADAFWGPSVHWNSHLKQYVMLLNRAEDGAFSQEGIYVAFSDSLEDPDRWSRPTKLLDGGNWYPQVMGLEPGAGTDRLAGGIARLFIGGRSDYILVFED